MKKWLMKLINLLPHREIGWKEIGEVFTRYTVLGTPWFNVYLHHLNAPQWHPECHDHPWSFVTLILRRGYVERVGNREFKRRAGTILYRPAAFAHNIITPYGSSWSLILTTHKKRAWGHTECHEISSRSA